MFYFKELQTISHQALADLKLVKTSNYHSIASNP
jgi:hypothetical protein